MNRFARLATQPLRGDVLAMDPTNTAMHVCQRRPIVEIMKCQVKISSYNLQNYARGEEGCLQLSVLARELEGMGIGLCGLQELCWPHVRECDIVVPFSVRGIKGKGIASLCGLGLTSGVSRVWAY